MTSTDEIRIAELRAELDKQHRIFEAVHDLAAVWWTRETYDWDDLVYKRAGRQILDAMLEAQRGDR